MFSFSILLGGVTCYGQELMGWATGLVNGLWLLVLNFRPMTFNLTRDSTHQLLTIKKYLPVADRSATICDICGRKAT